MEIEQKIQPSRLLIIGANGGIGKQCVITALEAGHYVTAVLRNPVNLSITHAHLEIVQGDIMQPNTFEKHLQKKDAVISVIGTGGSFFSDKPTTLYSHGNANVLHGMEKAGVKRAFFISASAIEISPVLPWFVRFVEKYIVQKLLKNMYADLREMEKEVRRSNGDWTIIRPPQLTDGPQTDNYRVAINTFLKNCLKISRADVAHFMIDNIRNEAFYKSIVEIGY